MAKLKLDLSQFKSSGIYTLEFDASESIVLNTQTVRLVIGYSRKGPFNAPVYLPDKKTAMRVFGDIDPFLERRGCFYHRMLYTCLDVGPVFGLSLMPLNNDPDFGDKVPYYSYSIASTEPNGVKVSKLYASFFNKERFWYPDEEYFLGNVNSPGSINEGKLFNIVNLGQTPVSVIIRKAKVQGFDVTAREWFGIGKVPTYMDEWDFISDYFVEMFVIEGDFTNYQGLAIDPVFSEYFDVRGLKKAKIREFLGAPEVNVVSQFTGCVIPDFTDGNGRNHSIDTIANGSIAATGVFIAIDKERLENYDPRANTNDTDTISAVDLVGHNFADPERPNPDIVNFLSYKTTIKERLPFVTSDAFSYRTTFANPGDFFFSESIHLGRTYGYLNNVISIPKPLQDSLFTNVRYLEIKNLLIPGQSLIQLQSGKFATVEQIYEEDNTDNGRTYLKIVYSHFDKAAEKNLIGFTFSAQDFQDDMAIYIRREDVPANQIANWENAANYPVPGKDILIEDKATRTWFYVKVKSAPVFASNLPFSEGPVEKVMVKIPVVNSSGLSRVVRDGAGFKAYFMTVNSDNVVQTPEFVDNFGALRMVFQPDKFEFVAGTTGVQGTATAPNFFRAYKYSKIYQYYDAGALLPGDKYYYQSTDPYFHYLDYEKTVDSDGVPVLIVKAYDTYVDGKFGYTPSLGANSGANVGIGIAEEPYGANYFRDGVKADTAFDGIQIYGIADNLYDPVNIISWNASKTEFDVKPEFEKQIQVGHYIVSEVRNSDGDASVYKLTRVIAKRKLYNAQLDSFSFRFVVNQPVQVTDVDALYYVQRYYPIEDFIKYYQIVHLEGFKMNDYHLPGGLKKQSQLWKILGMLDEKNSNLTDMLSSRDIITFRYVVDSFDGGLESGTGPKQYITRLAKKRQKCLAIMNMPSMKEFSQSNDPRFTEEPTKVDPKPILNARYIADGGNLALGPSFTFGLPDELNGSKFSGYFSPNLILRENGKNLSIPPAAHVSNLFVLKFINGQPYHPVAGPKRGVISDPKLVGLEYEFLQKDRDYLEPMGVNPIVKKKNVGYMIYANQMAYQRTHSAFNNLHVRDLLITIEEAIEDILANYLFEFNDASTRLEIKTIVEGFLSGVQSNGGIYDKLVIMDESNNDKDIIDQNVGIIDVAIEPARALHKFVNRVTVMKTGGISSGGFTLV